MPHYDGLLVCESLALNRRRYLRTNQVDPKQLIESIETVDSKLNLIGTPPYGQTLSPPSSGHSEFTDLSLMYSMTSLSLGNHAADTVSN